VGEGEGEGKGRDEKGEGGVTCQAKGKRRDERALMDLVRVPSVRAVTMILLSTRSAVKMARILSFSKASNSRSKATSG